MEEISDLDSDSGSEYSPGSDSDTDSGEEFYIEGDSSDDIDDDLSDEEIDIEEESPLSAQELIGYLQDLREDDLFRLASVIDSVLAPQHREAYEAIRIGTIEERTGHILSRGCARTFESPWKGTADLSANCNCKRNCNTQFHPEYLFHLRTKLESIKDNVAIGLYVRQWLQEVGGKFKYFLPVTAYGRWINLRVCRCFWQKAFGIGVPLTNKILKMYHHRVEQNIQPAEEKRGKWDRQRQQGYRGKVDRSTIDAFVNQLPKEISHFGRAQQRTQIKYLDNIKTKEDLITKYKTYCEGLGHRPASRTSFQRIWKQLYAKTIKLHAPRLDACQTCVMLKATLAKCTTDAQKLFVKCKAYPLALIVHADTS
jgi:hypothetical protein